MTTREIPSAARPVTPPDVIDAGTLGLVVWRGCETLPRVKGDDH